MFADLVRSTQAVGGYDDATAHRMALLAMEQYGLLMKSLQPDLVMASSELEIAERSWQHRAMVWMPSHMALADDDIPMNWDVSSDSLAAWLCVKIGADRLVLVKHEANSGQPVPIECLAEEGMLDAAFPAYAARLKCPIHVVGKADYSAFATALTTGTIPALAL